MKTKDLMDLRGNMRNIYSALVLLITLSGCAAVQQISQSAANNAKPASPPLLTDRPPSSALWRDAPTTFHIGSRLFTFNVSYNLFNKISVNLGGRQAVELTRGSSTGYPPIDRSQLASGKVYFRLTSLSSDANRQTEIDLLEIVDMDNVLADMPNVVSTVDLVVGETSINPAYAGTSNAYKESAWHVVLDRDLIGSPGSGGISKCTFNTDNPFVATGYYAPPGRQVSFNVDSNNCKAIGFMFRGQPTAMVEYPDIRRRFDAHTFTVPTDATNGSKIKFQIFGLDLLKRRSFYDVFIIARAAPTPPPLPCDRNNGFGGNKGSFTFCAICDGTDRVPFRGDYCSASEAQTEATSALSSSGHSNCTLYSGSCTICPLNTNNPTGQVQPFPYCVACPAGQFAWNVADGAQFACSRDDATQYVQSNNANCSVAPSLAQNFDICVTCPGQALNRVPVRACTDSQAVDMTKAAAPSNCAVAKCP